MGAFSVEQMIKDLRVSVKLREFVGFDAERELSTEFVESEVGLQNGNHVVGIIVGPSQDVAATVEDQWLIIGNVAQGIEQKIVCQGGIDLEQRDDALLVALYPKYLEKRKHLSFVLQKWQHHVNDFLHRTGVFGQQVVGKSPGRRGVELKGGIGHKMIHCQHSCQEGLATKVNQMEQSRPKMVVIQLGQDRCPDEVFSTTKFSVAHRPQQGIQLIPFSCNNEFVEFLMCHRFF